MWMMRPPSGARRDGSRSRDFGPSRKGRLLMTRVEGDNQTGRITSIWVGAYPRVTVVIYKYNLK